MKKLILILLLTIGVLFSSNAQKIPTVEEIAKKNIDEMDKRLKLTPTQKSIIYNYAFDMAKEQFSQPEDHPIRISFPEGEYLKGLLIRVL